MKIGNLETTGNIFLAPLAGYTDVAFRRLCRDFGAALTTTEMISVAGLNYRNKKTGIMTVTAPNENPCCVQLFGSEPEQFARAVTHPGIQPFDIIDINMGCPMRKVVSNGEGSALLDEPERAEEIVRALKRACAKPVTVKMRLGVRDARGAADFAKRMEAAGADMITVHGRTAKQMYGGAADWDEIRKVAAAVSVPVIGNGDITRENLKARLSGVEGVAVGRGAAGDPQLFGQSRLPVYEVITRHIGYIMEYFDERYLCTSLRKFFTPYLKGISGVKQMKDELMRAKTYDHMTEIIDNHKDLLMN